MASAFEKRLAEQPAPQFPGLEELQQPALQVLADFIHHCSPDPETRTLAVTLLVTSLCQLAGRNMMTQAPSTIVVNTHDQVPDAIDSLASLLMGEPAAPKTGPCQAKAFRGGTADLAPKAMANAITEKAKLGKSTPFNADVHRQYEKRYYAAQRTGFGHGPSRRYADAWHDSFGLLTDRNDEVILRLDEPQDRAALRKDVLKGNQRLRQPVGYGAGLQPVSKHISISGSMAASHWDTSLAEGLVGLGMPLLVLPSTAKTPPAVANETVMSVIGELFPKHTAGRVEEPVNLPPKPWFEHYGQQLRSRLRHFPGNYEYAMQRFARQLFPVCLELACWCRRLSGASTEEVMAVAYDLYGYSLRGLVLSVAGMACHGFGLDFGCDRGEAMRVLDYLRRKGPMSKGDLLRGAHVKDAGLRDKIVECYEAEGLVRVEGKRLEATSYGDFVVGLQRREEFPHPVNHWADVAAKGGAAA